MSASGTGGRAAGSGKLYVAWDDFERGLELVDRLLACGALRLLVGPPTRRLQFELREKDAESNLGAPIDRDALRATLGDIEDVLLAASGGASEERFAEVRSDAARWDDGESEDAEVARAKYQAVVRRFDVADLENRLWLKASAKTYVPSRFEWDVLCKKADDEVALPSGGPVAFGVLRLAAEPARLRFPFDPTRELVVTVDQEDVRYMIESLQRLEEAMLNAKDTD